MTPRVLLVIDSLVPGGAERSTVDLLGPVRDRGVHLELAILHDRPGLQDEVVAAGVPLHDLSGAGGRGGWTRRLRALMTERRPDLVHTTLFESDICGRTAAASLRLPAISTLTTEHYGQAHLEAGHLNRLKVRSAQMIDMATARLARRLHAVSAHVADTMSDHLRFPRDRIDVVYRGRAAASAERPRAHQPGGRSERPVVLLIARHEPAKGIDRAIAAFPHVLAAHPGARLLVAGREGSQTTTLTSMISQLDLGSSVELLGHCADVGALLARSDVLVLPSRREGLPGALLEAMAAGTPAVVNGLPQIREVVGPEAAVVVEADDPVKLGGGIRSVLDDPSAAARRAEAARARFLSTFTLDRSADGIVEVYHRALVGPAAR